MPVKASALPQPPPLAFFANPPQHALKVSLRVWVMHSFALMNIYHQLHSDREAGATFSHNEWLIWKIVQPSPVSPATSLYSN